MYKVDNAVILAAGVGSRLKHLTKKTPKPLLKPRDMVIIEDIILKLKEKGIKEIYIIVGYLCEQFNYLKNKFNIKLIKNKLWKNNNNITSLIAAAPILKNTLITNGDIILNNNIIENKFSTAITYVEENSDIDEWIVNVDDNRNIKSFDKDGLGKSGLYQRELTFITTEISIILKNLSSKIDLSKYYEDIVLEICHKNHIEFKSHLIKPNCVFDLDNLEEYLNYAK